MSSSIIVCEDIASDIAEPDSGMDGEPAAAGAASANAKRAADTTAHILKELDTVTFNTSV